MYGEHRDNANAELGTQEWPTTFFGSGFNSLQSSLEEQHYEAQYCDVFVHDNVTNSVSADAFQNNTQETLSSPSYPITAMDTYTSMNLRSIEKLKNRLEVSVDRYRIRLVLILQ